MVSMCFIKRKKKSIRRNYTIQTAFEEHIALTKSDCKLIVDLPELPKLRRKEDTEHVDQFQDFQHIGSFSETRNLCLDYQSKSSVLKEDFLCVVGTSSNEDRTDNRESRELLIREPGQPNSLPSFSTPNYCSSLFEDGDVFLENQCRSAQDSSSTFTELDVDTMNNDICEALITTSRRSPSTSSPNFSTKSETSALIDRLITIPPNADIRYFASALIDHNGGEVILEDTGIKLIIPEGALEVEKTEAVYLALVGNPDYIPQDTNSAESFLSPVVLCGPHGLCFKKHVLLILPHCVAVTDERKRQFRVLCSNTAPDAAPDWKEIFNQEQTSNEDVFCYMGEQNFSLFVQHFTWYTITGEGSARKFSLRAYHTSFHQPDEEFKVRAYFIPIFSKSNQCQKNVDEAESKLLGRLSDAPKTKIFHKRGGDVKVEACDISEGWKLVGENIQTEGYNELRLCHEEPPPNLTFRFQHVTPRPEGMSFKLTVSQEKCPFDTPVDISVSINFEAERKRAEYQNNNYGSPSQYPSVTASSSGYAGSGESTTALFIPTGLRKELMKCLDKEILGRPNWKMLAEHLGYKVEFIQWLDSGRSSPTERLLMEWETNTEQSPGKALRSLEKILWKMERVDAALKIQDYLEKLCFRKETTV